MECFLWLREERSGRVFASIAGLSLDGYTANLNVGLTISIMTIVHVNDQLSPLK